MNLLLNSALDYARKGVAVFPCKPDKKPFTEHGFQDASTDEGTIRQWWNEWPNAGIGMPTGSVTGRVVIDVDPRHGGDKALEELQAKYGALPATLEVKTGGGGRHLYFQIRGLDIRNSTGKLGPGLDVRGVGGYVILPPSPHPSGNHYEWANGGGQAVSDMPGPLLDFLLKPQPKLVNNNGGGRQIPAGQRNQRLASFAGMLRRKAVSEEGILAALLAENQNHCDPPLPDREVQEIAKSVSRYAPAEQEEVPGRIPITETSNAERLVAQYRDDIRYCADRGIWAAWNGQHWSVNDEGAVLRRMQEITRGIYHEAAKAPEENLRKALAGWAIKSDARRTQENSVAIARYFDGIEVRNFSEVFDTQPLLLNVKNGTIDLQTGELRPHRREDFLTKIVPVSYDPEATCPRFSKFLGETFGDNLPLIGYAGRCAGYFLTGLSSGQCWYIFHGPTASGKSTFVNILRGLLGPYAFALPENYFLITKNSTDFVTASLAGVRLATCVETNEGRKLDVARIKSLTGGDAISGALKYQNQFQFKMEAKLVLATNHAPRIPATDSSIWRRVKVLPFNITVPEEKRIPELAERLLEAEAPGILRWAVLGFQAWDLDRLDEPNEIKAAVSEYRSAEDLVGNFVEDRIEREMDAVISHREIYRAFNQWREDSGIQEIMSAKKFAVEMRRLGFTPRWEGDKNWAGVKLL